MAQAERMALGLDFGTASVRALLVSVESGAEAAVAVAPYASGVVELPDDPEGARQVPADYRASAGACIREVLAGTDPALLVGVGVDTTASTPLPVGPDARPLADDPAHRDDPAALAWLWKDHTAAAEAEEITEHARRRGEPYLAKCGGAYSTEWYWAKLLRAARTAPELFDAAAVWLEAQDYIPAWLCGVSSLPEVARGVCAAGHKAMYSLEWGGMPSEEFLGSLHPGLARVRQTLEAPCLAVGSLAGRVGPGAASATGLPEGVPVSVGGIDAHLGAVGAGIREGTLVKIMGTSTCDILLGDEATPDIPGVSGLVPGSVVPGYVGIEAGQAAFGDLFDWGARLLSRPLDELAAEAASLPPGAGGLLALDWNNGNRNVLADPNLRGLLVGQSLKTTPAQVYRALVEGAAYGARTIVGRLREHGVRIERIVACGGSASRDPLVLQVHADVLGAEIAAAESEHTCARGAAICGAVAAGAFPDFASACDTMASRAGHSHAPGRAAVREYDRLYALWRRLHDEFGGVGGGPLAGLMRELVRG